jgi:hypothetical protein
MWAGGSPTYGSSGGSGGVVLEEYGEGGATSGAAGGDAGGGSLPPFVSRFGSAFGATSRPSTVYGAPALATNAYTHQVPAPHCYLEQAFALLFTTLGILRVWITQTPGRWEVG